MIANILSSFKSRFGKGCVWYRNSSFALLRVLSFFAIPAQAQAATPNEYLIRTFIGEDGNSIDMIVVPGRPPETHREPAVTVPVAPFSDGVNVLAKVPAFNWCYGCSATAAAMIAGYYDNGSYPDMYTGPANGGVVPMNNSIWGNGECPLSATHKGFDGLTTRGHVDDYWFKYGSSEDPYYGNWTEHGYADCTADYMGTNQYYNWQNTDGGTYIFINTDGSPLYDYTGHEPDYRDGCHGFRLFLESRGYSLPANGNYSQYIYGYNGNTLGFTFDQFKAEIDAGRPVIIGVMGHSMVGYGYDDASNLVYIHDTWDHHTHTMTWGGEYSGLQHYKVSILALDPEENDPEIWRIAPTSPTLSISAGESISFTAGASDIDGNLDEFKWYLNGNLLATHSASGTNDTDEWTHSFTTTGTNTVLARIEDTAENYAEISWNIEVYNAPVLTRINPATEVVSISQWEVIDFSVEASDADADLSEFKWYLNDSLVSTTSASGSFATDSWTHNFSAQGVFQVTSMVFDVIGYQDSISWQVTVNPLSGSEIISVTSPVSGDTWLHYESNTSVEWNYPLNIASYDSVKIDLYQNQVYVDSYADWTLNDGEYIRSTGVDPSWGAGNDFQVRLEDNLGNYGWSDLFSIEECTGSEIITVTEPNSSTLWTKAATNRMIAWEYPETGKTDESLSGDSVTILLYKGAVLVDVLAPSIPNTGEWIFADSLPTSWASGSDYIIFIGDNLSNYGWGDFFEIDNSLGIEEPDEIDAFALYPIVPNPSHGRFTVCFAVPETASVEINLFDLTGRHLHTFTGSEYQRGIYTVTSSHLPPGMYFCTMKAAEFESTQRIIVIE